MVMVSARKKCSCFFLVATQIAGGCGELLFIVVVVVVVVVVVCLCGGRWTFFFRGRAREY